MADVYERLAEKMSNWPIRAPISKELRKILEALYTPEQAEILMVFTGPYMDQLSAKRIAKKLNKPVEEVQPILDEMARTTRIFSVEKKGKRTYSLFPLIPGLFEFYFSNYKRAEAEEKDVMELVADEFEKYYNRGFAAEIGSSTMPIMRVIPDQKVINDTVERGKGKVIIMEEEITDNLKSDILPFEQAKIMIEKSGSIAVMDCACRTHMRIANDGVPVNKYPNNVCMMFSSLADYAVQQGFGKAVTKEEALEILERAAKAGLVHTIQNITNTIEYSLCNCDRDCCIFLRGLNKFKNPNALASSNFRPEYNKENCIFCEKCVDLCPMYAIQHHFGHEKDKSDENILINEELCIGCGVCAFNCPKKALTMVKKFTVVPPKQILDAAMQFINGRLH